MEKTGVYIQTNRMFMKGLYFSIFPLLMLTVSGCEKDDLTFQLQSCQYSGTIIDTQTRKNGRIYKVADFWVIDMMVEDNVIRCSPCNLPDELKIENRNIILDADFRPIPSNVRMVGQPIEITKIY